MLKGHSSGKLYRSSGILPRWTIYSGLIYGHIQVIAGSILVTFNLTSWYRGSMAELTGESTKKKTR